MMKGVLCCAGLRSPDIHARALLFLWLTLLGAEGHNPRSARHSWPCSSGLCGKGPGKMPLAYTGVSTFSWFSGGILGPTKMQTLPAFWEGLICEYASTYLQGTCWKPSDAQSTGTRCMSPLP